MAVRVGIPDRPSLRERFVVPDGLDVLWLADDDAGLERAWEQLPSIEFLAGPPWVDVSKLRFGGTSRTGDGVDRLARALPRMEALRVIQGFSAGPQWLRPLVPAGVTLCDAQGVHSVAVAEWTVLALLALIRKLPELHDAQRAGRWITQSRARYDNDRELYGSTVLIVGYGSIGRAVEARLAGFEPRVVRVARHGREGVHGADALESLLPEADAVLLHLPSTEQTSGIVGEHFLGLMKPGALLVNASRGALVDNDALLAALHENRIHAAIDNTDPEPLPEGHVLWSAPNLLITPHVGSRSPRAHDRLARLLHDQLERFVRGDALENVVEGDY
jgi:phosphoglycerate dehydrogenase-like enzyme